MNRYLSFFIFLLASCSNPGNEQKPEETRPVTQKLCFIRVEGTQNQDSSKISLDINDARVRGTYNILPREKDSRKGTLDGQLKDSLIRGRWYFIQEGVLDTLDVEFKLSGNKLLQRKYKIDQKTGSEILDTSANFSIEFLKEDCN